MLKGCSLSAASTVLSDDCRKLPPLATTFRLGYTRSGTAWQSKEHCSHNRICILYFKYTKRKIWISRGTSSVLMSIRSHSWYTSSLSTKGLSVPNVPVRFPWTSMLCPPTIPCVYLASGAGLKFAVLTAYEGIPPETSLEPWTRCHNIIDHNNK